MHLQTESMMKGGHVSHSLLRSQDVLLQHGETRSFSSLHSSQLISIHEALLPLKIARRNTLIIKAVGKNYQIKGTPRGNRPIKLKAIVTIKRKHAHDYKERVQGELVKFSDAAGQKVTLQLVSTKIDPTTEIGKRSKVSLLQGWAEKANYVADKVAYVAEFIVDEDFGVPAAIFVINDHPFEFYLETISLEGLPSGRVYFPCYSWVHSNNDNPLKRVFFSNVPFLPQDTPEGIKDLRESDKASLKGTGKGVRKAHERIYDYDLYNDLGNPDKDVSLTRPTLGNSENFPYPRRCRTGRRPTETNICSRDTVTKKPSSNVSEAASITLQDLKKASSTLEDFCRSYLMFHDLNGENVHDVFKYFPIVAFVEGYVYQIDEKNESLLLPSNRVLSQQTPIRSATEAFSNDEYGFFESLRSILASQKLWTTRIGKEIKGGLEYWNLERRLCNSLLLEEEISLSDVMQAVKLRSFDYRVLNLLLYGMSNQPVNETHMEFLSASEILGEILDDLPDYEEDVLHNSFNILRMFLRIYGPSEAPYMLAQVIAEAEEKYIELLGMLEPSLASKYQEHRQQAVREGGGVSSPSHPMGSWTIPSLILDERMYRERLQMEAVDEREHKSS